MQISGIILAGGKSSRMGTDKTLLEINGKTLLQGAIDICLPVCNPIILSSNNPAHEIFNFPVVPDELKDCGPIAGIHAGLKYSETDWNFVLSVDSPFVTPDFIRYLISEIDNCDAVIPFHEKGKEPLIALYRKSSLPEIEKKILTGNYKMHYLLNVLNSKFVNSQKWIEKNSDLFRNLNRLEDF